VRLYACSTLEIAERKRQKAAPKKKEAEEPAMSKVGSWPQSLQDGDGFLLVCVLA
jgi:hypothetical protein